MIDIYSEARKRIKALQELEKHSATEIIHWVIEAIDTRYPRDRKVAFEIVCKRSWKDIRADIIQTVTSQKPEDIHKLREGMLSTDLLLNPDLHKKRIVIDGTLAVISNKGSSTQLLLALQMVSDQAKDPKLETYLLYRYFFGVPRLSNGILSKF